MLWILQICDIHTKMYGEAPRRHDFVIIDADRGVAGFA